MRSVRRMEEGGAATTRSALAGSIEGGSRDCSLVWVRRLKRRPRTAPALHAVRRAGRGSNCPWPERILSSPQLLLGTFVTENPFQPSVEWLAGKYILDDSVAVGRLHASVHVVREINAQAEKRAFGIVIHCLKTDALYTPITPRHDLTTFGNDSLQLSNVFTQESDGCAAVSLCEWFLGSVLCFHDVLS